MLVDKIPDAANLVVTALFFGQFVSATVFSLWVAFAGLAIWLLLTGFVLAITGGEK
jgi:hypothetical protein